MFLLYSALGALAFFTLFLVSIRTLAKDPGIHPDDKEKPFYLQRIRAGNPRSYVVWQERWLGWIGLAVPLLILPAIVWLVLFFNSR